MNPKKVTAWACERCGTRWRRDEHGERHAEKCCRCAECGEPSEWSGSGSTCKRCCAAKNLASAERHLADATESYGRAVQEMERWKVADTLRKKVRASSTRRQVRS